VESVNMYSEPYQRVTFDSKAAPQVWEFGPGPISTYFGRVRQHIDEMRERGVLTYPSSSVTTRVLGHQSVNVAGF